MPLLKGVRKILARLENSLDKSVQFGYGHVRHGQLVIQIHILHTPPGIALFNGQCMLGGAMNKLDTIQNCVLLILSYHLMQ